MRVTWIMPVCNAAHTVRDAVASIQAQTFTNWDMVIVDDGSTDGSLEVLQTIASEDPRLRVFSKPHSGLADTVNRALEQTDAPLIARMDADDLCHPQRLQMQVDFLQKHPEVGVVASRVQHAAALEPWEAATSTSAAASTEPRLPADTNSTNHPNERSAAAAATGWWVASTEPRLPADTNSTNHPNERSAAAAATSAAAATRGFAEYVAWQNSLLSHEAMALNRFVEQPLANPSALIRRELFKQHGNYRDGDFPEDYELWLRWLAQGVRFCKLPETLLIWRDFPTRFTRTDKRCTSEHVYQLKADYLAQWLAKQPARPVYIWGAGRTTRQRANLLKDHGVEISAWVDIDPAKIGQRVQGVPVIGADGLPPASEVYLFGYVGSRGARDLIRQQLKKHHYVEGKDYLMVA